MPTKYQTIASVHLTHTGLDADSTPTLAELQTTLDFTILGQPPSSVINNTVVPTSTEIAGGGLLLSSLNQITWFVPATFRFRVVEKDVNPVGLDLNILDRRYDFGTYWEDWADGKEHVVTNTVQAYTVTLKYQVVKLIP